eukprot:959726-Pyramimonas_sp.AAC.2
MENKVPMVEKVIITTTTGGRNGVITRKLPGPTKKLYPVIDDPSYYAAHSPDGRCPPVLVARRHRCCSSGLHWRAQAAADSPPGPAKPPVAAQVGAPASRPVRGTKSLSQSRR